MGIYAVSYLLYVRRVIWANGFLGGSTLMEFRIYKFMVITPPSIRALGQVSPVSSKKNFDIILMCTPVR